MGLTPTNAVEWSDWVIRLPGGDGSTEGRLLFLLVFAAIIWGFIRLSMVVNERLGKPLESIVQVLAVLLIIVLIARWLEDDGSADPAAPLVEHEIRSDECNDTLLDTCPPFPDDDGGGG